MPCLKCSIAAGAPGTAGTGRHSTLGQRIIHTYWTMAVGVFSSYIGTTAFTFCWRHKIGMLKTYSCFISSLKTFLKVFLSLWLHNYVMWLTCWIRGVTLPYNYTIYKYVIYVNITNVDPSIHWPTECKH